MTVEGDALRAGAEIEFGAPRHRRDVVPVVASARWRGGLHAIDACRTASGSMARSPLYFSVT